MTIEEIANRHGGLPDKELEIHTLREEVQRLTGERFKLRQQNAEYIEALRLALPYVQGAYECAFPDQEENDYVSEKIKSLINDKTA